MPRPSRIYLTIIGLFASLFCVGQHHADIQEYNNRLLYNPSFAGTIFGKRLFGTFIASRSPATASYTKILSADFYNPKHKHGIGITGGVRSNGRDQTFSMFGEGSYSKFIKVKRNQFFIPSIAIGMEQPFQDFGLFMSRQLFGRSSGDGSIPEPTRAALKSGFILANYDWNVGISGALSWQFNLNDNLFPSEEVKFRVVAHWMKTIDYKHRGLLSQRFYLQPRVILDYSTERTLVFSDIRLQYFRWTGGLGLLHNIENNKTRIAISAGYDFKRFKLNYTCSGQIPSPGLFEIIQSLNLRIVIPELNAKKNPVFPLIRDI